MQYNKKTFEQWWEFLKLSEDYRSICEFVSRQEEDDFEFSPVRLLNELSRNENFKPIEKYMKLLAIYEKFGNVHHNDFQNWWKIYNDNKPKSIKTEQGLRDYKEEKFRRQYEADRGENNQLKLYEGIRGGIIYFPDTYIKCHVNIHSPIKKIKSDIGSVIKELKREAEANQRERTDDFDRYLNILRLSKENYTMNKIIETIGSPSEKQDPRNLHTVRSYRKKKKNALSILRHVEEGRFP